MISIETLLLEKVYDEDYLIDRILNKNQYCWGNIINRNDISLWLDNFRGIAFEVNLERKLALVLLDNFIFITQNEVTHLCVDLFQEYRHYLCCKFPDYIEKLEETNYFPIGNPSESSSLIMYYYRMANHIPVDRFIYYPDQSTKESPIVFIDDISISATQAPGYIKKCIDNFDLNPETIFYINLISSNKAIEEFGEMGIKVLASCHIDERMKLFSDNSYINTNIYIKLYLKDMVNKYSEIIKYNPLGFKESELAIGFFYNIPNNTIPVIWYNGTNWNPMFRRNHKRYYGDVLRDEGDSYFV